MRIRTNDDDVELETALQELVLNLLGDGVETDVGVGTDLFGGGRHDDSRRNGNRRTEGGVRDTGQSLVDVDDQQKASAVNAGFPKCPFPCD